VTSPAVPTSPAPIHPAVYSANLVKPIAEWLRAHAVPGLLDPCAGLGHRLAEIADAAGLEPRGIEIEPGYFAAGATHPCVRCGDATALPFDDGTIGAAVTSFVYPNGMADCFTARDPSARNTYVHRLRAHLGDRYHMSPNNMAGIGNVRTPGPGRERFYELQAAIIAEVHRVLRPGAPFVVNTKDPPRHAYTERTRGQLVAAGFEIVKTAAFAARGLNHGANQHDGKAAHEDLTLAVKL
jgi:hypothetical protein